MVDKIKELIAEYESQKSCWEKWLTEEDNVMKRLDIRVGIDIKKHQIETAQACIAIIEKGETA